jgi:hypothetical protein
MKLVSAFAGLAVFGAAALSGVAASAMPVTNPGQASQASNVEQAAYVCNEWGHCWRQPSYGYGYGYGYGYYHPHFYGGWGWRWHRWHHLHQW